MANNMTDIMKDVTIDMQRQYKKDMEILMSKSLGNFF